MLKYILVGLLVFVVCLIAFAPASLVDRALREIPDADLINPRGTLWQGEGGLVIAGANRGTVTWDLRAWSALLANPTVDWVISDTNLNLTGVVATGIKTHDLNASGSAQASVLNEWLEQYQIFLGGHFTIQPTELIVNHDRTVQHLEGQIDWTGGAVRYTLSGLLHETQLPPLTAYLDQNAQNMPIATVYAQGESTPLLLASMTPDGYAKIAMTKLFTRLLKNPWPGDAPDSAIVLEVEEKIF